MSLGDLKKGKVSKALAACLMCGRLQSCDPPCRSEMIFFLRSGESSGDRQGYVVLINSPVVAFCCLPLEQRSAVKRSCDHIYYLIVFPPKCSAR